MASRQWFVESYLAALKRDKASRDGLLHGLVGRHEIHHPQWGDFDIHRQMSDEVAVELIGNRLIRFE